MNIYKQFRDHMIGVMQSSMKSIRLVMGLGVQELGDVMGLSRQSVNNLESGKVQMNYAQYVAFSGVIDYLCLSNVELKNIIKSILVKNDYDETNKMYDDIDNDTFLNKWFKCFPDELEKLLPSLSNIDDLTQNYKVFLDSTVLFHVPGYKEFSELCNAMEKNNHSFIIPITVVYEIRKQLLVDDNRIRKMANEALETLAKLQSRGLIDFRGEQNDQYTDSLLLSVFQRFKITNKLALITQDFELARQILMLNDDLNGFQIVSYHFNTSGNLEKWGQIIAENDKNIISCEINSQEKMTDDERIQEKGIIASEKVNNLSGWDFI